VIQFYRQSRNCHENQTYLLFQLSDTSKGQTTYYTAIGQKLPWEEASKLCSSNGMTLSTFNNVQEANYFIDTFGTDYWTGYHRNVAENFGPGFPNFPWNKGEPLNAGGNEDCVVIAGVGLHDVPCDRSYAVACQYVEPTTGKFSYYKYTKVQKF
jgi:hypothetical protein